MTKETVFSGIQPTGDLHLGNYLGAIKSWVKMQQEYNCIFCIVDLHAMTYKYDPKKIKDHIYNALATYIACGLDYKQHTIFLQSDVKEHAYLTWILSCITPYGWLNRMTQFKSKSTKEKENSSSGLYTYPLLMAADILLYRAKYVPVGEDQKQHLELAKQISNRFNELYKCSVLTEPEIIMPQYCSRIMSLKNVKNKMSKSDESDQSRINILDDSDTIKNKIMKASTDSYNKIAYNTQEQPEIANLLNIYASLAEMTMTEVLDSMQNKSYAEFKGAVCNLVIDKIKPIRKKIKSLLSDKIELDKILALGNAQASIIASKTIQDIKKILGY